MKTESYGLEDYGPETHGRNKAHVYCCGTIMELEHAEVDEYWQGAIWGASITVAVVVFFSLGLGWLLGTFG